jgi:hypothetical protein
MRHTFIYHAWLEHSRGEFLHVRIPFLSCILAAVLFFPVAQGCASKQVARLVFPTHVQAFCGRKEPRLTALLSVMTSTNDTLVAGDQKTDAELRTLLRRQGGVLGYWQDQPLLLPKTAHALGEVDAYARVRAAAVITAPEGATVRRLYLKVRDRDADTPHNAVRWIALDAFDVQNPCVEGHRAM